MIDQHLLGTMVDLANSRDFVRNLEKESIRRWYRLILSSNTSAPRTFLLARQPAIMRGLAIRSESSAGRLCIMNVALRDLYGGIGDTIVQLFDAQPYGVITLCCAIHRTPHSERTKEKEMKILMVLTSHDQLGNTGHKTGFWLEEFAAPYFVFRDAGAQLTLASPKGGQPPIDPKSDLPENQTPAMTRFKHDLTAQKALSKTVKLANMKAEDFDTVFYVGGHGPMWDLAENTDSIALIESFYNSGKPVALVCHSPGALHRVKYKGAPIVKGKRVTGFTNGEEAAVNLTNVVPFLVEDELKRLGGIFEKAPDWEPFSIVDGRLITGQNPASSTGAAQALLKLLAAEKAA